MQSPGYFPDAAFMSKTETTVHRIITAEKPAEIPKLNGSAFLNPLRFPLDMDMMLLDPEVTAVITA